MQGHIFALRRKPRWVLSWLVATSVFMLVSVAMAAKPKLQEGPRIMVAPVLGIEREQSLEAHRKIVATLKKKFGARVVEAAEVVEAQKAQRLWPQMLNEADGVAKLALAVNAERALVPAATTRGMVVVVYAVIGDAATTALSLPGVNPDKLNWKQARRVALLIERKAAVLLAAREEPALDVALGNMTISDQPPAQDDAASTAPFSVVATQVDVVRPSDEILEEERREAATRAEIQAGRHRVPAVAIALGLGMGGRELNIGGSHAAAVIPIENGALPSWSVHASVCPLKLIPALNREPLADLVLDLRFHKGLSSGDYEGTEIVVDDDAFNGRLSYRVPLFHHRYAPHLGLGVGGGWERAEIGCCLAAPSLRYVYTEAHARVRQPLLFNNLDLEALLAGRQVNGNSASVVMAPAWQAELWLVARLAPLMFARLGVQNASYGGWRDSRFSFTDRRTTVALEVGGYY